MTGLVLVLRPQPGADETAQRARGLGLEPVVAPLFAIRPRRWHAPDPARFDAVMLTSANAIRHAGPGLGAFRNLPAFAVGEATAGVAAEAGFAEVRTGPADAAGLAAMMAAHGVARAFHPRGEDSVEPVAGFAIEAANVYAADPVPALPAEAEEALARGALVLLHSPRGAARFAALAGRFRPATAIAAISPATAAAAGPGWRAVAVANVPRDHALLELAAKLCQNGWG